MSNFSRDPVGGRERAPVGTPVVTRPVYSLTPLEPANGAMLLENGCFLLLENDCFLELE